MSSTEFPTSDRREPSLEGPPLGDPSAIQDDRPGQAAPWDKSAPLSDRERPAFDHQPLGPDLEDRGDNRPQARNRLGLFLLVAGVLAGGALFVALFSLFQDLGVGIEPPAPAAEAQVGGAEPIDAEPSLPDKSEAFFAELGGNIEDIRASLCKFDSLNGTLFAALSRTGRLDLVSAGERYAGWRVEAIDPSRRRVLFVRGRDRAIRQAPQ
jgi:hypothetical protein